ncbi:FMN-linked oxidoreductase [Piedraia hortae CBS 480.64]|uniref:tRNA-dihydrouridine(16/17) synthase [NAD(P)(+)] n=1 Tax=Piedraia hortae CBS 480.64 TaxID=1314780 RepID=A0A6A7BS41_9PEZI|nr:FMN-linked oxidoreductase [Piedraia hortae CBS 480.64]
MSSASRRSLSAFKSTMTKQKLHGRAFYESIGSPKHILAPMVDQSEFVWRMLTRSFLPPELRSSILAYTPMFHAKLFAEKPKYRAQHFEPMTQEQKSHLDGNPKFDRPLFVQFCANDADVLLEAAKYVVPYCDAVDLNLGCPQGIAKRGRYGAFLQENWDTIRKLINTLHLNLDVPVTAKFRILESKEKTLSYAKMMLDAGASILTVHGRQREQKGHQTGLADYQVIRYLREMLPKETVIFANGNILQHDDIQKCLDETGVDGVMSAEGNLYDPSIFCDPPPVGQEGREYWRGRDGKGGYRADAVLRRYLDLVHKYVLGKEPPRREPLFITSDVVESPAEQKVAPSLKRKADEDTECQVSKKQRRSEAKQGKQEKCTDPNLVAMQAHCFHILRPLVAKHHGVRDALAKCRAGDIDAFEDVLTLTEEAVKEGLCDYATDPFQFEPKGESTVKRDEKECSDEAVKRCRRPYWVCQPYVRPLPKEALEKGSLQLSKKEIRKEVAPRKGLGVLDRQC